MSITIGKGKRRKTLKNLEAGDDYFAEGWKVVTRTKKYKVTPYRPLKDKVSVYLRKKGR